MTKENEYQVALIDWLIDYHNHSDLTYGRTMGEFLPTGELILWATVLRMFSWPKLDRLDLAVTIGKESLCH